MHASMSLNDRSGRARYTQGVALALKASNFTFLQFRVTALLPSQLRLSV